jgi:hypothetical protein
MWKLVLGVILIFAGSLALYWIREMKNVNTWTLFLASFCVGGFNAFILMITWQEYESVPHNGFQKKGKIPPFPTRK